MIKFILLFVFLGAGLFIGTQFSGQQGYVLISIADKTLEMSVTTLVIFVALFFAAFFVIELVLKKALQMSSDTWNWFSVRKLKRSRRLTNEGIIKLVEGDWKLAEKKVTRWANHHDMPLLCYLIAAEAAQEMGDREKRDFYLEQAAKQDNSLLAVDLTKAKQRIQEQDYSAAVEILNNLVDAYPNNPRLLTMLKTAYLQLSYWPQLIELLPRLKRNKLISLSEFEKLMLQAQIGFIEQAATTQDQQVVLDRWSQLPKIARNNINVFVSFIKALITTKAGDAALPFIKDRLKSAPAAELYALLTELELSDPQPVIKMVEQAVHNDQSNAEAHSALARLYMQQGKLAEAQQHFESALALRSSVTDYGYLAEVLEQQNMESAANDVSRKALALISPAS